MYDVEKSIAQADGQFKALIAYVRGEAQQEEAHVVEKRLFREGMRMLLALLEAYFAAKEGGGVGPAVQLENGEVLGRERIKTRRYLSVFGELELRRAYYHEDGQPGVFPLDGEANLPERAYSYFVQELVEREAVRLTYEEAVGHLEELFGWALPKRSVEQIAPEAAREVEAFYESEGTPSPESEGEILVVAVDGKGVPMKKEEPAERKVRLKKGEKHSRKKQATVVATYTIAPQERTVGDILVEVRGEEAEATGEVKSSRPRPQNKRVRASLEGKEESFQWARHEVERRDAEGRKKRVCLMDGDPALWRWAQKVLVGFTFILDLFHVLEYLWKAAYVFHAEGSAEAEAFVRHRLQMLLEGKVGYVIGGLREMLTKQGLTGNKQRVLEGVVGYLARHREYMRYDEYLSQGLPIGSGVVEGACRHLVQDRMEGAGMRWRWAGAEAILKTRAVYLNGDWDRFWAFHVARERERRFGASTWHPVALSQETRVEKPLNLAA